MTDLSFLPDDYEVAGQFTSELTGLVVHLKFTVKELADAFKNRMNF